MLDRTDFESWQQWIRLFCLGKDNGENVMKSITKGSFRWERSKKLFSAAHPGPECDRVFADLSADEKERYKADIRATNILLQGNLNYTMNLNISIKSKLNSKFVNNMLPEWSRFITEVKLNRGLKESNFDQLYAYLKQHEDVRGRYNGIIKEDHFSGTMQEELLELGMREDKMLLMQAQENDAVLDEDQLLFFVGEQVTNFDDDVDDPPEQDLALNVYHVFEADQCDAFDFDVDEVPTTHTMFMANLSSKDLIYNEVGPSYDSNTPFELQYHDNFTDNVDEYHEVHEMQNDVQHNYAVDSDAEYTSDSNIISYDRGYKVEDTLEIAEITRNRMFEKMNSPLSSEANSAKDVKAFESHNVELNHVTALLEQNEHFRAEIEKLAGKMKCVTSESVKTKVLAPGMYAIDVEPIP
nr:hypothetical protein [Tanacetum cinerariifolium]